MTRRSPPARAPTCGGGRLDSLFILEYSPRRCVLLADAAHEGGSYKLHQRSTFVAWPIGSRTWAAPNTRTFRALQGRHACGSATLHLARGRLGILKWFVSGCVMLYGEALQRRHGKVDIRAMCGISMERRSLRAVL